MVRRFGRGRVNLVIVKKYFDDALATALITIAIFVFVQTHKYGFKFKYGRYYAEEKTRTKMIVVDAHAAWCLMNIPGLIFPCWFYYRLGVRPKTLAGTALVALWVLHYAWRAIMYPCIIRGGKTVPFATAVLACLFCSTNSFLQMLHALAYQKEQELPLVVFGAVVFLLGMFINIESDWHMRSLRKKGEVGYRIPSGGLFDYVSCANYFGEVIEWTGFAIVSGLAPSPLGMALFMWCFLGPRALQHHEWYYENFKNYPTDRKAIIPMVL